MLNDGKKSRLFVYGVFFMAEIATDPSLAADATPVTEPVIEVIPDPEDGAEETPRAEESGRQFYLDRALRKARQAVLGNTDAAKELEGYGDDGKRVLAEMARLARHVTETTTAQARAEAERQRQEDETFAELDRIATSTDPADRQRYEALLSDTTVDPGETESRGVLWHKFYDQRKAQQRQREQPQATTKNDAGELAEFIDGLIDEDVSGLLTEADWRTLSPDAEKYSKLSVARKQSAIARDYASLVAVRSLEAQTNERGRAGADLAQRITQAVNQSPPVVGGTPPKQISVRDLQAKIASGESTPEERAAYRAYRLRSGARGFG